MSKITNFFNIAVTTQNIEPENSTVEASSSSLSPSSKFNSEPETTPLPLERSFVTQKLAETIAPRERGFPLPEIKRARELSIAEKEPLSTTLPFIVEIDRSTNSEVKSDHPNYQNSTEQE